MAYPGTPTIPRGEEHFFNLVYTGTSTGQTIGRFLPFTNNGTISRAPGTCRRLRTFFLLGFATRKNGDNQTKITTIHCIHRFKS